MINNKVDFVDPNLGKQKILSTAIENINKSFWKKCLLVILINQIILFMKHHCTRNANHINKTGISIS